MISNGGKMANSTDGAMSSGLLKLGRFRAIIRCRADEEGPLPSQFGTRRHVPIGLALKPIFLPQRHLYASGRLRNIAFPAGPGCEQQHFRAPIPIGPRLPELFKIRDELRGVGKRLKLRGSGAIPRARATEPIRFQNFRNPAINLCNDSAVEGVIRHADLTVPSGPGPHDPLRPGPICT